ncbi:MAG: dephospho-CoA kinase [Gemmatimonadota bacterium]
MESLLQDIIELLIRLGPWVVLLVTATETAFFIGLLIPAEATVLVAAFMAQAGYFSVVHVLLATILGGLLGDQIGYVLGRTGGRRAAASAGRLGRLWRQHEARALVLFRQRSILAVSAARFISFVRTLMPWFAGMSRMSYGRFLLYDAIGVIGWGTASVGAGYLAGRSWHVMASALGTASTLIILALLGTIGLMTIRSRRRMRSLLRVALTGNIASGKSAVAEVWQSLGADIIDADDLARRVVEPGTDALRAVVAHFGDGVLHADGSLDRAALRAIVFGDDDRRLALEAMLHPEIERLRLREERGAAARGEHIVVHSIPLLFETGLDDGFDVIVLVDAPDAVRRDRLVMLRGIDPDEADRMMAAQLPASTKRLRAHYVIENDAGLDELTARAGEVWMEIRARNE